MSKLNYAAVLKYFISIANIKTMLIAKVVGYDISYVSKWCSNSNLPPKKNIDGINKRLSESISAYLIEQKLVSKVAADFDKNINDFTNKEEVNNLVLNILTEAYSRSYQSFYSKNSKKTKSQADVLNKEEIIASIIESINSAIKTAANEVNMIFTSDILALLKTEDSERFDEFEHCNVAINIYIGIDMDELEKDIYEGFKNLYKFLNYNINVSYVLFDNKCVEKLNTFVIKDNAAYIIAVNNEGIMETAAAIYDKSAVNRIYKLTYKKITDNDILLKPSEAENLEKGGFRTKFYTAANFHFFSCNGFEFLLPFDIIENGIAKEAEERFGKKTSIFVRMLQITWEERFINANMNFYMPKSNILKYVEKGGVYYTDVYYELSVEQRQRHVRNIIECMRKNPNINLYIIDDDDLHLSEDFFNISVFFNESKFFLKKTGSAVKNNSPWYYVFANDKINEYLKIFFEELKKEPFCRRYDAEEIAEIVENNEKMMLRMLELKDIT